MQGWRDSKKNSGRGRPPDKAAKAPPPPPESADRSASSGAAKPGWRQKRTAQKPDRQSRSFVRPWNWIDSERTDTAGVLARRLWRSVLIGSPIILFAGTVWYLLLQPQSVPLLAAVVGDYVDLRIPSNASALLDVDRLVRTFRPQGSTGHTNVHIQELGSAAANGDAAGFLNGLAKELGTRTRPGGPGEDVVLVYLSAHGVVNGKDEPCLLLGGSDPLDSESWLPVAEALKRIARSIPSARRFFIRKSTRKVVLLDIGRIRDRWSIGVLDNGFAGKLEAAVNEAAKEIKDPNFVVIAAAGAGERAWTAPDLDGGGTAFGYFLAQGLGGKADSEVSGNRNGEVSLLELNAYLEKKLTAWSAKSRSELQQSRLLTRISPSADFPVAFCESSTRQAATGAAADRDSGADSATVEGSTDQLDQLWIRHAGLSRRNPWRFEPVRWAELELYLEQMEQLTLDGVASNVARSRFETLRIRSEDLLQKLEDPARHRTNEFAGSLAQQARRREVPGAWQERWNHFADATNESAPLPARIDEALAQASPGSDVEPIEIHFLRMLKAHLDFRGAPADQLAQTVLLAAAIRRDTEDHATPDDERVQYWLHRAIEQADATRRKAEDRVFVGSPAELERARVDFDELTPQLVRIGEDRKQLESAYAVRDEALAKLPHLARWVLESMRRSLTAGQEASEPATSAKWEQQVDHVTRLVEKVRELCAALDGAPTPDQADARASIDRIRALAGEEVRPGLDDLKNAFDQDCKARLSNENGSSPRELLELLSSPLVASDVRIDLRRQLKRASSLSEGGSAAAPDDRFSKWLSRRGKPHPLLALAAPLAATDAGDLPAAAAEPLSRQEAILRRELASRSFQALARKKEVPNPEWEFRQECHRADRQLRTLAPLTPRGCLGGEEAGQEELVAADIPALLRRLDLYFESLWHCRRTLDDFWGPPPEVIDGRPYFETASEAYLAAAGAHEKAALRIVSSRPSAGKDHSRQRDEMHSLLRLRSEAASRDRGYPISPRVRRSPVYSRWIKWAGAEMDIAQSTGAPRDGIAAFSVSTAEREPAAVSYAGDAATKAGAPGRRPVGPLPAIDPVGFQLRSADAPGGTELLAAALYRGHLRELPFKVRDAELDPYAGLDFLVTPPRIRVALKPPVTKLLLIFDMSGSMSEPISRTEQQTKISAARKAVAELLGQLSLKGEYEIGLMLYGHRAGWREREDKSRYVEYRDEADRKAGLHPSSDVHIEVPIARLDDAQSRAINDRLREFEPLGQTPLFLATKLGLLSFLPEIRSKAGRKVANRQIVVITDGKDEPGPKNPDPVLKVEKFMFGVDSVRVETLDSDLTGQLPKGFPELRDVKIDFIGFGLAKDAEGTKAMKGIAADYHGDYYSAADAPALGRMIRKTLERAKKTFTVRRVRDGAGALVNDEESAPQEEEWQAPRAWNRSDGQRGLYRVVVNEPNRTGPDLSVELSGGESLSLELDPDRGTLRPRDLPERRFIQQKKDPTDAYSAGVFESTVASGTARFRIEIARAKYDEVTPSPAAVWGTVFPLDDAGESAGDPYRFLTTDYEPDQPLPVVGLAFTKWPRASTKAKIELSFLPTGKRARSADKKIRLQPVDGKNWARPRADERDVEFPEVPGFTFRGFWREAPDGRGWETLVEVTSAQETPRDLPGLTVEPLLPLTVRGDHRYYDHRSEHVFHFDDSDPRRESLDIRLKWVDAATPPASVINVPIPAIPLLRK